ncbi:MAG: hypothetical protein GX221_11130 [Candidatus Riflebacteria bacterium]|nr:hypothetical protein [Candidatus Riflebacteria bacterium]
MKKLVTLHHEKIEKSPIKIEISALQAFIQDYPDNCRREAYLTSEGTKELSGPMLVTFAIRTAKDIVLEDCLYQNLSPEIEAGGKVLPQLPPREELISLLEKPDSIIKIKGRPFKPATQVLTFQHVYDDAVKCIGKLKSLGVRQDDIMIFATPEEISLEIHQNALNLGDSENLDDYYKRFLIYLGEVKESSGKLQKGLLKTMLLDSCDRDFQILIPGNNHPTLHRARVAVGPSHFAYGIAAFSDYCGKKRSLQESLQEVKNWLNFLNTPVEPAKGLSEIIKGLPPVPVKSSFKGTKTTADQQSKAAPVSSNVFQPFKQTLLALIKESEKDLPVYPLFSGLLNKNLQGGWRKGGIHIIAGPEASGKSAFLTKQIFSFTKPPQILYLNYEKELDEFALNAALMLANLPRRNLLNSLTLEGNLKQKGKAAQTTILKNLEKRITDSLHVSCSGSLSGQFDVNEVTQFAAMLPDADDRLIIIDGISEDELAGEDLNQSMTALKKLAKESKATIALSVRDSAALRKTLSKEAAGDEFTEKYSRYADSLLYFSTERENLRKFGASLKGSADKAFTATLEQKAITLLQGKRFKSDTYPIIKVASARCGMTESVLFVYQRETGQFHELASAQL